MIIALIRGGFANQLYKYACAYATAKKYHQELIMITQTANAGTDPFQSGELALEYSEIYHTESYIETFRLLAEWGKKYRLVEVMEPDYLSMISSDLFEQYDGVVLYGTYQPQIYFENYIEDLRSIFRFKKESLFLKMFREEIAGKQSVAIHVRRGDFLTYDGLCRGMEYYKAAMCLMEDILGYGEAEYYVFSDDREFVRSYFGRNKRIHYVSVYGDYREGIEEFLAISMCSHGILTQGSSFSRMADALSGNRAGYVIYEKQGFENMVFTRENLIYLDLADIKGLAGYYKALFEREMLPTKKISEAEIWNLDLYSLIKLCMDTRDIDEESEIVLRIKKIELLNEQGNYAESLGQVRKLWEIAEGGKYESRMHELYWKCLYAYGYRLESLIEAIYLEDVRCSPGQYYDKEEQEILEKLYNTPKDMEIVLVPSRRFQPHIFEDMIHTGSILKRLGYRVTFMFREPTPEMGNYQPYTKTLHDSSFYEDIKGHSIRCPLINLTEKETEYGSLKRFFDIYFDRTERIVLFAKQNQVLDAAEKCVFSKKITTVYWDYSHISDAGNYKEIGEMGVRKAEVTAAEMLDCYNRADYSITFGDMMKIGKSILRLKDDSQKVYKPGKERYVADYYRIDPVMIENTFSIIGNILHNAATDEDI